MGQDKEKIIKNVKIVGSMATIIAAVSLVFTSTNKQHDIKKEISEVSSNVQEVLLVSGVSSDPVIDISKYTLDPTPPAEGCLPPGERKSKGTKSGCYDYYTLSQFWTNSMCGKFNPDGTCVDFQESYTKNDIALHGLWPQFDTSVYKQPFFPQQCKGNKDKFILAKFSNRDEVEKIKALYPNNLRLASHEWSKHGTCTQLSAENFFALLIALHEALPAPQKLLNSIGQSLSYNDIVKMFDRPVIIACKEINGKQSIVEIRTGLTRDKLQAISITNDEESTICDQSKPIYITKPNRQ